MKPPILAALCLTFLAPAAFAEELLRNGSFEAGESKWDIEGKAEPVAGPPPALRLFLHEKKWTLLEQELDLPKDAASTITVVLQLEPSADFLPAAESKAYDAVDFAMGGSYGWTARVFPKADFLITVRNSGGWDYRPVKIKQPGQPQEIKVAFEKVKFSKNQQITFALPPGAGSLLLKSCSASLK